MPKTKTLRPPAPDELYEWMRVLLDLPPETPISSGFFRFKKFSEFYLDWWDQESQKRSENFPEFFPIERAVEIARRFPLSIRGLIDDRYFDRRGRNQLTYLFTKQHKLGYLFAAEVLLRRDIEVLGRARVAAIGLDFYLRILNSDDTATHHEKLETVQIWRENGFFAGEDAAFRARFAEVWRLHQRFLAGEVGGERAVLCGRDLREVAWPLGSLRNSDLRGVILRNLNRENDDLSGCDLRGADLKATILRGANLGRADLRHANLDLTLFQNADLDGARLDQRQVSNDLTDWDGNGPRFRLHPGSSVCTDFSFLDLQDRNFSRYDGERNPNFSHSDLRGAIFDGGCFNYGNFSGCDLRGASLRAASLDNANFCDAQLDGADVCGASLQGADFSGADITKLCDAQRAQWDESPPQNRDFRGVAWLGARYKRRALEESEFRISLHHRNFSGCDFSGADLRGCALDGANFSDANLEGADLRGCCFEKTDLRGANLRGARVSYAKLKSALRPKPVARARRLK